MILPDPRRVTWDRWAATVVGFNPELANQLHPNVGWENFASFMADTIPGAPQPDGFEEWQSWAVALKRALQS